MINAVHTLICSDDAVATRAFFRDVLDLPVVDDGDGWLIFKLPPAELGVHPAEGSSRSADTMRLSLMCDDVASTIVMLEDKGVAHGPVTDHGYGLVTTLELPGGVTLDLYEPRHATAHDLEA